MATPNPYTFIIYVSDAQAAAAFYGDLLDITPVFDSPRFIAFELSPGVQLAVWSGSDVFGDTVVPGTALTRTSELCLSLGSAEQIDARFTDWRSRGVQIVAEPYDDVFGRTFVAADPDGNLIRVAPVD
ncbi:VOC family protein [Corynebacterium kalidii]|uniref:VOC family protein n=1 Tax=Corynebacterium kalidii TaxID=2931982 RepID=A0A9X2B252_9CORY|nr:VOC family protein [Corynebacterium kalidii]MCJ7858779.1 VOC family protein [Corynebacterium kalidii]